MTTRDYTGLAELLDAGGDVIDQVRVALRCTVNPNGVGEWGGKIHPGNIGPGDWMEARKIRLDTDETGDVAISNVDYGSAGTREGWIVGSGAPPF